MKSRMWKYGVLFVSGGILLQLGGCGASLLPIFLDFALTFGLRAVLDLITGDTTNTTTT